MAVCARGSVPVFYVVFAGGGGVSTFCENKNFKKYGSRRFSGSGADDHQLYFLYGLMSIFIKIFML